MKHLDQRHVLVLGLGASGLALARWCAHWGARVTVADTREAPPQLPALREAVPAARFVAGAFTASLVEGDALGPIDLVLKSPGLAPSQVAVVIDAAAARGTACGNELSLFAQALKELAQPVDVPGQEAIEAVDAAMTPGALQADQADQTDAALADVLAVEEARVEGEASQEEATQEAPVTLEDLLGSPQADAPSKQVPRYHPQVIAITGTNGKTTVTSLTGQLVARAGKSVAVAGNIGPTLLEVLLDRIQSEQLPEVWVLELSSFQLDQVIGFEPTVATVLNLSQDHLDWHGSMQAYAAAKARVYGARSVMLLNRDDALLMAAAPALVKGKQLRTVLSFGAGEPQRPGDYGIETASGMAWLVRAAEADETIKRRKGEEIPLYVQRLMPVDALRIRGRHNATNALAALGLAVAAGCGMAALLHGLRDYKGEPHRMESVATVHEVEYFDDSKGTNVGATVAALTGLGVERKLVVILGGDGKGQDFTPLAEPVARYARAAILIGRDAPQIRAALQESGVALIDAASMQAAVEIASRQARPGDAVLMSPACASFDMFDNYGHRAAVFCEAVHALAQDAGVVV